MGTHPIYLAILDTVSKNNRKAVPAFEVTPVPYFKLKSVPYSREYSRYRSEIGFWDGSSFNFGYRFGFGFSLGFTGLTGLTGLTGYCFLLDGRRLSGGRICLLLDIYDTSRSRVKSKLFLCCTWANLLLTPAAGPGPSSDHPPRMTCG